MDVNIQKKAAQLRIKVLTAIYKSGSGHVGGAFSVIEILVALYYGGILRIKPKNPKFANRDRFICKGQASFALYTILVDLGFFDISLLKQYGKNGSCLGAELNIDTPGVEYNTGSLGNGLGIGAGMALAAKMDKRNYRVFVLMGDGECDEGSIWEAATFASQHQLNNLIGIVDRNRLSVTQFIEDDGFSGSLYDKFKACGWQCATINGHSFAEIFRVLNDLENIKRPLMIIANTIKGKGVSFMENAIKWHHSVPTKEEFELAMKELKTI